MALRAEKPGKEMHMEDGDKAVEQVKASVPPAPKIEKVSPEVRRARAVLRRISSSLEIKERKARQKKSRQDLKKSTIKPSSGHVSPRPGRHSSKLVKHLRNHHAK